MNDSDFYLRVGKLYDDMNHGLSLSYEIHKCRRASERLDIVWDEVIQATRRQTLCDFRFMCFKYLRDKKFTCREIGSAFGNRDHTTVVYGNQQCNYLLEYDADFQRRWTIFLQS